MSKFKVPEFDIGSDSEEDVFTYDDRVDAMIKKATQEIMDLEDAEMLRILGGTASSSLTNQRIYRCF